ncbi:MAG: glycosyl hydrolase family 28-related protein [Opitutaceae bacterium]|nr:glycosyl hydrolase family 28-related protein [Opitutaceae bacterium]
MSRPATHPHGVPSRAKRIASILLSLLLPSLALSQTLPSIPQRTLSVLEHGAKPNDGIDDTWHVNEAIKALAAKGGGTILFPKGTYTINPDVYSRSIQLESNIRLQGERDASGTLVSVLKMPRPGTNRSMVTIGDRRFADEGTDTLKDTSAVQHDIEICDLAFDLDNGHSRRAIQLRYRTLRVWIHDCVGFQSGIDSGEPEDTSTAGDNHFFNMASFGEPGKKLVSEDVTIERCSVRGNLQLTADGGAGIRNLVIRNNAVTGAYSHGIAITTVSDSAYFENILIENNQVLDIKGDGLYISHDGGNGRIVNLVEGSQHRMTKVVIRNNRFELGPSSMLNSGGVHFGTFKEMSDITFENNTIAGSVTSPTTSRYGLLVNPWDLNFAAQGRNAVVTGSAFQSSGRITIPTHHFISGMQVEIVPASKSDVVPTGIDAFRRYRIRRVDANTIELLNPLNGLPLMIDASKASASKLNVNFSPAIENMKVAGNVVSPSWDYGVLLGGSVGLTLTGNSFSGPVVVAGEMEALQFTNNSLDDVFRTTNAGCSLLSSKNASGSGEAGHCLFKDNDWLVSENSLGPVFGVTAVVTFDPLDSRRTMNVFFSNNTVKFQSAFSQKFNAGLRVREPKGSVLIVESDNDIDRKKDLATAHLVTSLPAAAHASPSAPVAETPVSPAQPDAPSQPSQDTGNQPELPGSPTHRAQFVNLSCRSGISSGDQVLIIGVNIVGTGAKEVLLRAAGPALREFGLSGAHKDPKIELYSLPDQKLITTNDDWSASTSQAAAVRAAAAKVGAFGFDSGSRDAALLATLTPGSYTMVVTSSDGSSGIVLGEIYDLNPASSTCRLSNIAARAMMKDGDQKPIIGFAVAGSNSQRVLLRAAGPSLRSFQVSDALRDPILTLHDSNDGRKLVANDDWTANATSIRAGSSTVGAFPLVEGSFDAALVTELSPGRYSAVVDTKNGEMGIVLVEAYSFE